MFDKLQVASLNNRRLREENEKLKEKVAVLSNKLENLEQKNKEVFSAVNYTVENVNDEISGKVDNLQNSEESKTTEAVVVTPEIEYGSKIIGDIILNSTESVNALMSSNKDNVKELINLIMGKTEVAKAEILDIISSDSSFECKTAMMDSQAVETKEYFKSVLYQ
ncbi:MAG: hypothetical protein IJN49_04695 [Clostridia bacterium]|nr:hypothetical protein [Clostridia bacterium]